MRLKPGTKNELHSFAMIAVKASVGFKGEEYFTYKNVTKY